MTIFKKNQAIHEGIHSTQEAEAAGYEFKASLADKLSSGPTRAT